MSTNNESFNFATGPYAYWSGTAVVTGLSLQVIGIGFSAMQSHAGSPQFCEPSQCLNNGQATLDSLSRVVVSSNRDAGTSGGAWALTLSFARVVTPNSLFAVTFPGYAVPLETADLSVNPRFGIFPSLLPADFMRDPAFATPAIDDELVLRVRVNPNEDLIDTQVSVNVWLFPGAAKNEQTNKGAMINAKDGRY